MTGLLTIALAVASVGEYRGTDRPLPDDDPSVLSEDGRFRVHWSLDPDLAPIGAEDGTTPPGVQTVLDAIVIAEQAFRDRGYESVVGDDGRGGDDALDLYFVPIDANGYAYPLRGQAPDGGATCYMELDSGLRGDTLASVAQHELHHCVQFRYTTRAQGWLYEASATWEQYLLADESLDLGLQLLYAARLSEPDRPLNDRGNRYEYAGLLVFRHLEEYRRPEPRSVQVWRELRDHPWQTALDRVTDRAFDLPVAEWFAMYSTYNAFACGLSDGLHYDETLLECTSPTTVPLTAVRAGEDVDVVLERTPFASAVFEVAAEQTRQDLLLQCDAPRSGTWLATLTAVDADGAGPRTVRSTAVGDEGALRWTGGVDADGAVRIVVASVGEDPLDMTCRVQWADRPSEESGGCTTVSVKPRTALWLLGLMSLGIPGRRRRR